ncbi:hypothetical protein ASE01_03365 [Nocardioides sp. Root190]|uniref:sensor histidine kinase n=1 Tax=Nocardioides sp. Root190 TaxID=1736488 RepID=UPI0006FB6501|nr:HAMP domain-containing sensor histidine kinase [Nocardioides sp. Root190]KRB78330.1 hypothetical protein ASE01_03365 [Nocardioides sp. Root190]
MRERLVIAFVGLTLAVIGLYGIPRAYFLADLVRERETTTLEDTASMITALVEERVDGGGSIDSDLLVNGLSGAEHIVYRPSDGGPTVQAGSGRMDDDGGLEVTRNVPGGRVELSLSGDTVSKGVRDAITPLVLLGLALGLGSAIFGLVLARRLSQPFQELAEHSSELGHGRFDLDIPTYAVPEAEAIGASLRGAAARLDDLVRREREFAANASHQLRTPITALRLSLEDLTLWPETPAEVSQEIQHGLGELDRLSTAIDELLALARGRRIAAEEQVDLVAIVHASAERWTQRLTRESRELQVRRSGRRSRTQVPVGPLEQVLDVLIDNARKHGEGTITIEVRDADTHLEIVVSDEGSPQLGPEVFHRGVSSHTEGSEGIGLALASELVEVCGGHLSLDATSPTTRFVVWLPPRDRPVS